MIRNAVAANRFYDGDPKRLRHELGRLVGPLKDVKPALAVIAPHAGYMYSGHTAAAAYARVNVPSACVVIGPNHTGLGSPAAIMSGGYWTMPMGTVPVEEKLANDVLARSRQLKNDIQAHLYEHSIEVQIPFLQYRQPNLKIVPICLAGLPYQACEDIGRSIAGAIETFEEPVLLIASTDMSHYEPKNQAEKKDRLAIERILALDPQGLFNTIFETGISMCGVIPTTVTLIAAMALNAERAVLVDYSTSGDTTGDYQSVVGYASIIID
ncbi:MAG: AmmeMemoRadiSam system protein B [Desulfobacteraceae bacterium]|nr:AmmeMemoRadiSam system protein B [Desulfobacteraceae bacterium]